MCLFVCVCLFGYVIVFVCVCLCLCSCVCVRLLFNYLSVEIVRTDNARLVRASPINVMYHVICDAHQLMQQMILKT